MFVLLLPEHGQVFFRREVHRLIVCGDGRLRVEIGDDLVLAPALRLREDLPERRHDAGVPRLRVQGVLRPAAEVAVHIDDAVFDGAVPPGVAVQLHRDVEVPEPPVQSGPRGRIDNDLRALEFERAHRIRRVFVKADDEADFAVSRIEDFGALVPRQEHHFLGPCAMYFAVSPDESLRTDEDRRVVDPVLIELVPLDHRPGDVQVVFLRLLHHQLHGLALRDEFRVVLKVFLFRLADIVHADVVRQPGAGVFGEHQDVDAVRRGVFDVLHIVLQIGRLAVGRDERHAFDPYCTHNTQLLLSHYSRDPRHRDPFRIFVFCDIMK